MFGWETLLVICSLSDSVQKCLKSKHKQNRLKKNPKYLHLHQNMSDFWTSREGLCGMEVKVQGFSSDYFELSMYCMCFLLWGNRHIWYTQTVSHHYSAMASRAMAATCTHAYLTDNCLSWCWHMVCSWCSYPLGNQEIFHYMTWFFFNFLVTLQYMECV